MRYFIELAYSGTAYHGWQVQDDETTVQQLIEQGLKFKVGLHDRVTGCGRTDTGVHARQFFAHFDLDRMVGESDLEAAVYELNRYLPNDIVVFRIFAVQPDTNARFDARSRTYKYFINQTKDPFTNRFAWTYRVALNVEEMNRAAGELLNHSDFTSFAKLHTDVKTNKCKIEQACWMQENGKLIFTITADRFLRNMVRAIVGTLVEVGRNKLSLDGFRKIIEAEDRGKAGMSAPAMGLFLEKVDYNWENVLT